MKKNNYKDNLEINEIGDYIVEGTNISETLRNNKNQYLKVKKQRNDEAWKSEFYKSCFGITLAFLVMIIIVGLLSFALKNEPDKKGLEYCQNQGYSYDYCQRGL